jgi:hypothetical protein
MMRYLLCRNLQELVLGRIGSRLKSSWYFPPMQQQLLQSHQEDGQAEDQAATDEAAAEQAAAAAAGQAAGALAVLAGVVSRDGSRMVQGAAAAGAATNCDAGPSSSQQCVCSRLSDKLSVDRQQRQHQQECSRSNSCCLVVEGESSWVAEPAAARALPVPIQQQQPTVVVGQQAEGVELAQMPAGVAVMGQGTGRPTHAEPDDDHLACVAVQVLLAGPANEKLQLQGPSLSNEQMAC